MLIPIEVSARHIHIKKEDLEILFGKGYKLTRLKDLSQPSMYVCKESLKIKTEKACINKVIIVGPERAYTQVEIPATAAYQLGIRPPVRESGDLEGTPGIILVGPKGEISLKDGVILAQRHLHLNPDGAKDLGLSDNQKVKIEVQDGQRSLIFKNVSVRIHQDFRRAVHVDTDEGNAAGIDKVGYGKIVS